MAAEIETPSVPSTLYRYRSLGKGLGSKKYQQEVNSVINDFIYCASYKHMNDALEGLTRPSSMFDDEEHIHRDSRKLNKAIEKFGLASFSESYQNDPMWAHYANKFNGIVVQYNFRELLGSMPNGCSFVRVNYSDQAPLLKTGQTDWQKAAKTALTNKNPKWMGEREWRLLSPMQKEIYHHNAQCVRRIFIGARVSPETQSDLQRQIRATHPHVRFYEMKIDGYDIDFELIKRASGRSRRAAAAKKIRLRQNQA